MLQNKSLIRLFILFRLWYLSLGDLSGRITDDLPDMLHLIGDGDLLGRGDIPVDGDLLCQQSTLKIKYKSSNNTTTNTREILRKCREITE